ncbi:SpoIIE family protein phosphatase [Sphaerisporangium melleum]|nr:GAF domain-containing SpoIIE family protein phosphatase [Sphaerisporangium melleum]
MTRPHPGVRHPSGYAAMLLDTVGRVTQWPAGAVRLFGLPPERAVGRHICDLLLRGTARERVRHALAEAVAGRAWSDLLPAECSGGHLRDLTFHWEPLDLPGVWGAVMVTATDTALSQAPRHDAADDAARERVALLNALSVHIGAPLDPRQAAAGFVDVAVPRLADTANLYVVEGLLRDEARPRLAVDGSVRVRRLALKLGTRQTDERLWLDAFPLDEVVTYPAWHPATRCMTGNAPIRCTAPELRVEDLDRVVAVLGEPAARFLEMSSFLTVPLTARGIVVGFIGLTRFPDRPPFDEHDKALAEDLALRAAMSIDNARLYTRLNRTMQALQQNLAPPPTLTGPPGLDVAHCYHPASEERVGGDWYDVISLSETRIALVIGDAIGHGPAAAGAMVQLRAAVRALADNDHPPDQVLRRLDRMAEDMDSIQCATCLYAVVDLATHTCALACAGHPPPILAGPGGDASVIDLPPGLALGLGDAAFPRDFTTVEISLPPGSTLAFYTDGLVESREQDIDRGIATLRDALAAPRDTLEATCEAIMTALPRRDDDVALLLTRTTPPS